MRPSSTPRVSVCLIYALSLFMLTTGALPAFSGVLISVDKSTQGYVRVG